MNKGLFSVVVQDYGLVANVIQTALQVKSGPGATARSFEVVRWGISFNGVSPSEAPVQVDLLRQTSAGGGSFYAGGGDAATGKLAAVNPQSDPIQATALVSYSGSEPTSGQILETYRVTPYGGLFVMQYAPDERPVVMGTDNRIGIRCLALTAVRFTAFMIIAE